MSTADDGPKTLFWQSGEVKPPPFSEEAQVEVGQLLRRLPNGERLGIPFSRPTKS